MLSDYANWIIIISIMKFNTSASLVVKCWHNTNALFFRFPSKYRVKTSNHDFADIIQQNKQGFDGKKRTEGQTGRTSLHFNNMWSRLRRIGYRHTRFKLFFLPRFPVCFACYAAESFKIICLTCIWLKFVNTSFHSSQKKSQKHHTHWQTFCQSLKDSCVKLKLPGGWKLGPYLAKPINFLWAKFGGNRK